MKADLLKIKSRIIYIVLGISFFWEGLNVSRRGGLCAVAIFQTFLNANLMTAW